MSKFENLYNQVPPPDDMLAKYPTAGIMILADKFPKRRLSIVVAPAEALREGQSGLYDLATTARRNLHEAADFICSKVLQPLSRDGEKPKQFVSMEDIQDHAHIVCFVSTREQGFPQRADLVIEGGLESHLETLTLPRSDKNPWEILGSLLVPKPGTLQDCNNYIRYHTRDTL